MANDPYMPWFVGDFMASTATWTGPERGLYLQLLGFQWTTKSLPTDLTRLARCVNYDPEEFRALWPVMASKFHNRGGLYFNPRLEEHRARGDEIRATRAAVGRMGGLAKAKQLPSNSQANATDLLKQNTWQTPSKILPSDPIHSDSDPNPSKTENQEGATSAPPPVDNPDAKQQSGKTAKVKPPGFTIDRANYPNVNFEAFDTFVAHRIEIREPLRQIGAERALKQLARFSHDEQQAMVSYSVVGGYTGLYEPKPAYLNGSGGAGQPKVHIPTVAELEERDRLAALAESHPGGLPDAER